VLSRYYRGDDGRVRLEHFGDLRRIAAAWYARQVDLIGEADARFKRLVRFEDATRVAASVFMGIEHAARQRQHTAGAGPSILPLLNHHNPRGSTAYVSGTTTKPVFATTKSHVNRVVADTNSWEQIAAKTFEQHPRVESYVKNVFLGFEVPYVDAAGTERRYLPDFILRVLTPQGRRFHLVIEVTGFAKDKAEKRYFMRERWLPAVNGHLELLQTEPWYFFEVTEIERVKEQLQAEIDRLSTAVDSLAPTAPAGQGKTAWDVFQVLLAMPDEMFEGIRNPAPAEYRPGLLDDDEY
jgi:type III restriction enzyme